MKAKRVLGKKEPPGIVEEKKKCNLVQVRVFNKIKWFYVQKSTIDSYSSSRQSRETYNNNDYRPRIERVN